MKKSSLIKDVGLAIFCLLLTIPTIIYGYPFLVGADNSYTLMSGSMAPTLRPGDLVIVKKMEPTDINIGDIVTITSEEFTYTHRVVEKIEDSLFRLKGDANDIPDQRIVESSQIIGKVIFVFPFSHIYTPFGFASTLLIPAFLIIGKLVYIVYQYTRRKNRRETMRWRRNRKHLAIDTTTILLALILTVSTTRVISPHFIAGSSSYFSELEWVESFFLTGIWHIDALVEIKPDTLNLDSKGKWVTVYAEIETSYNEEDIVVSSVKLDGISADGGRVNGSRLIVKFDRAQIIEYLDGYSDGDEVELTVSGKFNDGVGFSGVDTIVIKRSEE